MKNDFTYKNNNYNKNNNFFNDNFTFDFIEKGFVDEKGNLRAKLVTSEAVDIATYLKNVTSSQLRAFYNEFKTLKIRLDYNNSIENFEKIYPSILIIKSKITYRTNKEPKKLISLKNFIYAGIDKIIQEKTIEEKKQSFECFALLFEIVLGYCK